MTTAVAATTAAVAVAAVVRAVSYDMRRHAYDIYLLLHCFPVCCKSRLMSQHAKGTHICALYLPALGSTLEHRVVCLCFANEYICAYACIVSIVHVLLVIM